MDVALRERGVFLFGPFRLDPVRRSLLHGGIAVTLTARLFDTLLYMVQNADRLVTRDELESAVWLGRTVEEGNLQKALSDLRRALQASDPGTAYLITVQGRGLRFAVPVAFEPACISLVAAYDTAPGTRAPSAPLPQRWHRTPAALGMVLIALAIVGYMLWHFPTRPKGEAVFSPPPHSVAVLAFSNLSGDPAQAYFCDGLSEELINALGRIDTVRVAARDSAFLFKGGKANAVEIARRLNVGTVLEGAVRRDGQNLRMTAQLIDGVTGYQIWSHSYDRKLGDILALQGEIAAAVVDSLSVKLLADQADRVAPGTRDPAAYDAFLSGLGNMDQVKAASLHTAVAKFDEAIERDPAYADAHSGRANALVSLSWFDTGASPQIVADWLKQALAEASLAVKLNNLSSWAHTTRGFVLQNLLDMRGADEEYARGLALAPGSWNVQLKYALFQALLGHASQAIAAAQNAVALGPLSNGEHSVLGLALAYGGRYDEALVELHRAQALATPTDPMGPDLTGLVYLFQGKPLLAMQECAGKSDLLHVQGAAIALHRLGHEAEAQAILTTLRSMGDGLAFQFSEIYAQWGNRPAALHWLQTAYRLRDEGLMSIRVDPFLNPIRDAPEFKEIEQKLDFPP